MGGQSSAGRGAAALLGNVLNTVAVITPVYGNEATLDELARRIGAALADRPWRLRFVIDASPDRSLAVAQRLAQRDPRIHVTALDHNAGQNRALIRGLADEPDAHTWVCLDADLQDPPEAIPKLLDRLATAGDTGAVFAGRRGRYESMARRFTGHVHRRTLARLTGLPPDAGAFVAMGATARDAVIGTDAPSLVAAIGLSGVATTSVPVERATRPQGRSAWTSAARLRQSARTLAWVTRQRASQRCTSVSA